MPVSHTMGSPDAILKALVNDVRQIFGQKVMLELARLLYRWGFLPEYPKKQSKVLGMYLTNMARAMCVSMFRTRVQLEVTDGRDNTCQ